MGLIVLGLFTFSLTGLQGGILQMVGHGIYMAGLFLLIGMLYARRGSHEMEAYGGIAKVTPLLSAAFLWMMVAAAGLPGFAGFPGEILILVSAYQSSPLLALTAISGFVLSAWYLFNFYGKVFFGPVKKKENQHLPDLSRLEGLALIPLIAAVLWVGLNPNFFLQPMEKSVQLNVIEKLKPPPAMTDFAAEQRRIQEAVEQEKKYR